tara:strand:- start:3854 stop:4369 length:516 start_codon:yes stop_codon:yes gene_type:complete
MLNVQAVSSCNYIAISAKSYIGGFSGTIEVLDYPSQSVLYTATISFTANNGMGRINLDAMANLGYKNGLFVIRLIEEGVEQVRKPLLNHCDIDCCLAKLTNELLDCACDCAKCASSLAKAQKIFLLLDAANVAVDLINQPNQYASGAYLQDIYDKYSKAKELCDGSCGCDC